MISPNMFFIFLTQPTVGIFYSNHVCMVYQGSGLEYTMTVTRLPTFNDVLEEETSQCTLCPEAVQRTLATMLDISLLTSPTFLLLCISGFTTMMGFFIPFMFLESKLTIFTSFPFVYNSLVVLVPDPLFISLAVEKRKH